MEAISVKKLSVAYESNTIIEDMNLSIPKGKISIIIGANGCGKSTLLKIITKQLEADKGSDYFENPDSVGYLSQQVIDDIEHTLLEEMELAFKKIKNIEEEMAELIDKMERGINLL